ncbi:MAG: sigma-70 family RNA polymerase sigma factor [Bacteroidetes bacterium]|nr:sigma-70 family RNA polymerase sigma factor [Bacteroidota bacterium]MDA1119124.1 sigma-70 family RNA polymerase sigma factor [Bacteroidota bacterium]
MKTTLSLSTKHSEGLEPGQQSIHKYLVIRCKEGDRRAQNELYSIFAKAMFNTCRRMMGNDEDGRDVMQDGFIDAFTKIENLRDEVTFGAWLKRIMINHCINALKKKRLEVFNFDEKFDIPDKSDDSLNDDFTQTEIKRIMKAIDQISDGCKTVLNLYLFEGYDHKEIGQILAISESASKSQYSKARVKIRKVLEKTT